MTTTEYLWQNGNRVEAITIAVPTDRRASGFWLGDGLFETLLVQDGAIFARERHIRRLTVARRTIGLELSNDLLEDGLGSAIDWIAGRSGQIRVTLLSSNDLIITAREHRIPTHALKLIEYPFPKNERSSITGLKTLSYGENAMALRYAYQQGFDDVVFCNLGEEVMESALANLLLWDGSTWWTPRIESGCLPGVTRELLIESFGVKECEMRIEDLLEAKSLALTSSLRDIQWVSQFKERSYPAPSEVDRLRTEFREWRAKNPNP